MRSIIPRGESRGMRSKFHWGLSRLSHGHISVHWDEMRSKFQREVYPVKYETPFHGVNPMKSAKHFIGGRPDMALFLFTKAILEDKPIQVFNNGNMVRDFTYVDDIVEGVMRVIDNPPLADLNLGHDSAREFATDAAPSPQHKANSEGAVKIDPQIPTEEDIYETSTDKLEARSSKLAAPYKVYNIGNSSPVQLMEYIGAIEKTLNKEAVKEYLPMQPGDVIRTEADVTDLVDNLGYKPNTPVSAGIDKFIKWYKSYFKIQ